MPEFEIIYSALLEFDDRGDANDFARATDVNNDLRGALEGNGRRAVKRLNIQVQEIEDADFFLDPETPEEEVDEALRKLNIDPEELKARGKKFMDDLLKERQFMCPRCNTQHDRGAVDGFGVYRCLNCGYVGPRKPKVSMVEALHNARSYLDAKRAAAQGRPASKMSLAEEMLHNLYDCAEWWRFETDAAVEKAAQRAREDEREKCAKVCEAMIIGGRAWTEDQAKAAEVLHAAANAIRNRQDEAERLDEAIQHAAQVAASYDGTASDSPCAREHRQLATWLRELKERRSKDES